MKSFLKWAGGKYSIIETIKENLPKGKRLVEPFVGSGAVFIHASFEETFNLIQNDDVVYCDPPYVRLVSIVNTKFNINKMTCI